MQSVLLTLLVVFQVIVLGYFILLNGYYLSMSTFAFRALRKYARRLKSIDIDDLIASAGAPAITVIVPTYNEEAACLPVIRSLLTLNYPSFEIIIVNDGSTDRTLEMIREEYRLVPAPRYPLAGIKTARIRGAYQSQTNHNLLIVDKENGQRADAINAGLVYCRTPLFCVADADSLMERDALIRVVRPFLEDETTVASGGIIRIVNGCSTKSGLVHDVRLPRNLIARFQVLEYLRSFLSGRVGWDALNIMLLVSGAFGLFKTSLVTEIGGFDRDSIGEDLELTVRLHRHCREHKIPYRITFVPDPVAWTEAPERIRVLGRQRDRWQRGLIDTMVRHRKMLCNPRYGRIGMLAYPYFFFLEMMGPVIEFLGYVVFVLVVALGIVSVPFAIALLLLALTLGVVLSVAAVGLEELCFRRYTRFSDLLQLFGLALLENIVFRQILTFYRFKGTVSYLRGEKGWGKMERKGLSVRQAA